MFLGDSFVAFGGASVGQWVKHCLTYLAVSCSMAAGGESIFNPKRGSMLQPFILPSHRPKMTEILLNRT